MKELYYPDWDEIISFHFFLSSPMKSLYQVKLLTEVSTSKVHAIQRNSKEAFQNLASAAAILNTVFSGQATKLDVIPTYLNCAAGSVVQFVVPCVKIPLYSAPGCSLKSIG